MISRRSFLTCIFLFIFLFCFQKSVAAQDTIIFKEDFNNPFSLPSGWVQSTPDDSFYVQNITGLTQSGLAALYFESYGTGVDTIRSLTTPLIDCSGRSRLFVSYFLNSYLMSVKFEISADSGLTWQTLGNDSLDIAYAKLIKYDISSIAGGKSNVFFRFSCAENGLTRYFIIDDFEVYAPVPMVFQSATTMQTVTDYITPPDSAQYILTLKIKTAGRDSALSLSSITFPLTGTTNLNNISSAKVYYAPNEYAEPALYWYQLVGQAVVSPSGTLVFNFSEPIILNCDSSYFFLALDISAFNCGEVFDAGCTSLTLGAVYTPTITFPDGLRAMTPCATVDSTKLTLQYTNTIRPGSTENKIIQFKVYSHGAGLVKLDTLVFSLSGTTSAGDISRAIIYNDYGEGGQRVKDTVTGPGSVFAFTPKAGIYEGSTSARTHTYYLHYDITENAGDGDSVDADFIRIYANGTVFTPGVSTLTGKLPILRYVTGTKVIGSGGDYSSFTSAITELNTRSAGPGGVIYDVKGEDFAETPPIINSNAGRIDATVTFRKKAGESRNPKIIPPVSSTQSGVIYLDRTDYLTWDAIDIDARTSENLFGIYILNGGIRNNFKNSTVLMNPELSSGSACVRVTSSFGIGGGRNSYNKFLNLTLGSARHGIYITGASSFPPDSIYIGTEGSGSMKIGTEEYPIGSRSTYGQMIAGIYVFNLVPNLVINNCDISNIFGANSSGGVYNVYGIYLNGTTSTSTISNNKIHAIISEDSSSVLNTVTGMALRPYSASSNSVIRAYNNLIYDIRHRKAAAVSDILAVGILSQNSNTNLYLGKTELYHNSVLMDSTVRAGSAAYRRIGEPTTYRNNIFANYNLPEGSAVAYAAAEQPGVMASYNNYYTTTGPNVYPANLSDGISSTNFSTLSEWQTATSADSGSYNTNPVFISRTNLNISPDSSHISTLGTNVGVTTDIKGLLRPSFPYLGAYEHSEVAASGTLNLRVYVEGFYNPLRDSLSVEDTITVYLRKATAPYTIIETAKGLIGRYGRTVVPFTLTYNDTLYYLSLKHRNTIETWAALPNTFSGRKMDYDFSTSADKAYGANQVLKGSRYCLYSGDVNNDGVVDLTDLIMIDNDNSQFVTGYAITDITGDMVVDLSDLLIVDNNNSTFISVAIPSGAKVSKNRDKSSRINGTVKQVLRLESEKEK